MKIDPPCNLLLIIVWFISPLSIIYGISSFMQIDISDTLPEKVAIDWKLSLKEPIDISLKLSPLSQRRIVASLIPPPNHNNNHQKNQIVENYLKDLIDIRLSEYLNQAHCNMKWKRNQERYFLESLVTYVRTRLTNHSKVFD